ncbi:hypothetical protein [Methylomonas methanica]|uniref:hypothetical protein n=1 Tax=Methylomonas methanica TaxID=421 RepID=UPI000AD7B070|nr:hypothetical protein [Methylomonas methanica]
MKNQPLIPTQYPIEFRRRAEQQLAAKPDIVATTLSDDKALIHELQVLLICV